MQKEQPDDRRVFARFPANLPLRFFVELVFLTNLPFLKIFIFLPFTSKNTPSCVRCQCPISPQSRRIFACGIFWEPLVHTFSMLSVQSSGGSCTRSVRLSPPNLTYPYIVLSRMLVLLIYSSLYPIIDNL